MFVAIFNTIFLIRVLELLNRIAALSLLQTELKFSQQNATI